MRGAACLLLLAVSLPATLTTSATPAAAASLPYTAFVTGDNVYVRSGPGRNYYPTDKLQKGDQVEVYRHDPGGWYAIRPPRNSFSWVSSRYVEKTADGLGRAKDDQAVVRVGSRLSNIREVVQVRLDPGEAVEILETFNAGGQTWYKIAPPAGEFRWMYGKYLSTTPPDQGPRQTATSPSAAVPPAPPAAASPVAAPSAAVVSPVRSPRAAVPRAGPASVAATDPPPRAGLPETGRKTGPSAAASDPVEPVQGRPGPPSAGSHRRDGWQSRGGSPAGDPQTTAPSAPVVAPAPRPWQADRRAIGSATAPAGPARPGTTGQAGGSDSVGDQINRLEHQLSLIVAEDPGTWQFDELREVASRLLVDAGTATERARVRQVLGKISRFQEIQQRRVQMGLAPALVNHGQPKRSGGLTPVPVAKPPRLAARPPRRSNWLRSSSELLFGTAGKTSPFDGIGTLRPVVSSRRDAPRYALVDHQGQVVSFVTPGPGVNLQPYIGRRIGVRGNRGYLPELRRTNVMARRITALDAGMVR